MGKLAMTVKLTNLHRPGAHSRTESKDEVTQWEPTLWINEKRPLGHGADPNLGGLSQDSVTMWMITAGLIWCFMFGSLPGALSFCPHQCSCTFYRIAESTKARVILCNDPEMTLTPVNYPEDTFKLRIEKTAIQRVPGEAFRCLHNLEFLWMPYNDLASLRGTNFRGLRRLQELRLDGNRLTSFPWEALLNMPQLRLLDLHNNQLDSIPADAAQYIQNIKYLDLSSNKLVTLPQELPAGWLNLQAVSSFASDPSKIILGLHDNPWVCDCTLYETAHALTLRSPNLAFVEPNLKCAHPQHLAGVSIRRVELRKCQSPAVQTPDSKVKTTVGSPALLQCGATGMPLPELSWQRADEKPLHGTVHQEISSDGTSWSLLRIPVASYFHSGEYVCTAKNFLGATETFISLIITESKSIDDPPVHLKGMWDGQIRGVEAAVYNDDSVARYFRSTSTFPTLGVRSDPERTEGPLVPHDQVLNMNNTRNLLGSLSQQRSKHLVRSVRVIGDTDHSVSLTWKSPQANHTTVFNIFYAIFGERDMRRINVEPGKTKITIRGLMPKSKYIACVCVKGLTPKKEECIIFSTDEAVTAKGIQKLINVVVVSVACVIAIPLTLVVCCRALKRRCKKCFIQEPKEIQDSCVIFEGFSPRAKTPGTLDESNRLFSSRSSVDSEGSLKRDGQPNEYFC